MSASHAAIEMHKKSIQYAMEGNKEGWLGMYAADALVCDPVGPSPFDPEGKGHRGRAAIEKFWDTIIGPAKLTIVPTKRIASGPNVCAVAMTATNQITPDKHTIVDMIVVYELNAEGKISSLRAHWDWSEMERQLKELGFM